MNEGARPPERFSLCTWNCFGAAQGLVSVLRGRGAAAAHRFEHPDLHEELTRVDILCAQELWLEDAVHAFHKPAHLPHRLLAENRWTFLPLTIAGSGLGIASRYRVVASRFASFSRPHAGSERFARKGMAYARIALPSGSELDVVTTHMQSGYTDLAQNPQRDFGWAKGKDNARRLGYDEAWLSRFFAVPSAEETLAIVSAPEPRPDIP